MSLGILGGTFNPIHRVHLRLAEAAKRALDLERVFFMPAGDPPLKSTGVAPAHHRLAMVRCAVADHPGFEALAIEIGRPGPSYTVDTLEQLSRRFPDEELWFICGADALADLEAWRSPERLFEYASFAVVERPGSPCDLEKLIPGPLADRFERGDGEWVHESGHRLRRIPFEATDVSATQIRARLAAKQPIDDLVPEAVARYVDEHQLYREAV